MPKVAIPKPSSVSSMPRPEDAEPRPEITRGRPTL